MKLEMFHLMPYRELPEDFREKYHSVWVDVPSELCDPLKSHEFYNQTLDELEYAAALGFDGTYTQLRYVNLWPKPIQKPHPPIWIPGGGSIETWAWCVERNYLYAYLSYSGFKRGKQVMGGFWKKAAELGVEPNPYRAGFLQLVA